VYSVPDSPPKQCQPEKSNHAILFCLATDALLRMIFENRLMNFKSFPIIHEPLFDVVIFMGLAKLPFDKIPNSPGIA